MDLTNKLHIRRSIYIDAPPERVWQEFETFERFSTWFGVLVDEFDRHGVRRAMGHTVVTYEPRADGWVEMQVEVEGSARRFGGRITTFEPPRELTFEDHWLQPHDDWPAPLLISLLLTASGNGTMVELVQHGFEAIGEIGAETHRGHEGGWTTRQLEALRAIVERPV